MQKVLESTSGQNGRVLYRISGCFPSCKSGCFVHKKFYYRDRMFLELILSTHNLIDCTWRAGIELVIRLWVTVLLADDIL